MTGIELALGQSWDCIIMVIDSFKMYLWRASNYITFNCYKL